MRDDLRCQLSSNQKLTNATNRHSPPSSRFNPKPLEIIKKCYSLASCDLRRVIHELVLPLDQYTLHLIRLSSSDTACKHSPLCSTACCHHVDKREQVVTNTHITTSISRSTTLRPQLDANTLHLKRHFIHQDAPPLCRRRVDFLFFFSAALLDNSLESRKALLIPLSRPSSQRHHILPHDRRR